MGCTYRRTNINTIVHLKFSFNQKLCFILLLLVILVWDASRAHMSHDQHPASKEAKKIRALVTTKWNCFLSMPPTEIFLFTCPASWNMIDEMHYSCIFSTGENDTPSLIFVQGCEIWSFLYLTSSLFLFSKYLEGKLREISSGDSPELYHPTPRMLSSSRNQ